MVQISFALAVVFIFQLILQLVKNFDSEDKLSSFCNADLVCCGKTQLRDKFIAQAKWRGECIG